MDDGLEVFEEGQKPLETEVVEGEHCGLSAVLASKDGRHFQRTQSGRLGHEIVKTQRQTPSGKMSAAWVRGVKNEWWFDLKRVAAVIGLFFFGVGLLMGILLLIKKIFFH